MKIIIDIKNRFGRFPRIYFKGFRNFGLSRKFYLHKIIPVKIPFRERIRELFIGHIKHFFTGRVKLGIFRKTPPKVSYFKIKELD